jgi:hypothetical protein
MGLTHGVSDGEDVDCDDYDPSADAIVGMDTVGCVEKAHESHAGEDKKAAVKGGGAAAPFVHEHEGYDCGDADEDCGDAGGEEGGF